MFMYNDYHAFEQYKEYLLPAESGNPLMLRQATVGLTRPPNPRFIPNTRLGPLIN